MTDRTSGSSMRSLHNGTGVEGEFLATKGRPARRALVAAVASLVVASIVILSFNTLQFFRSIDAATKLFLGESALCIVDENGKIVAASTTSILLGELVAKLDDTTMTEPGDELSRMLAEIGEYRSGTVTLTMSDGGSMIVSYHALEPTSWTAVVASPAHIASDSAVRHVTQTMIIVGFLILSFVVIFIIMMMLERHQRRQIEQLAFVDPLTNGMSSPRFLIECKKSMDDPFGDFYTIVSINLKDFRLVNENFGIELGDKVLCHVYDCIESCLRPGEYAVRTEADTYYLMIRESDRSGVEERITCIFDAVNRFNRTREYPYYLELAVGAYIVDDPGLPVSTMIDRANTARKEGTKHTDGICGYYDVATVDRLKREKRLVDLLGGSIENGEFVVHLQPKVRLSDGTVAGAEALVRWNHPDEGFLYPTDFIPVFEKNGTVAQLDLFVFEKVCAMIAQWIAEGRVPLPVSVNLSRRHFKDPEFLVRFKAIADDYAIPDGLIELELTESIFFDDEEIGNVKKAVHVMHDFGFTCSLDDFGSGYSSLGLLKEFDVDALKLDGVFFVEDTERGRDVIEAIVSLSNKLGLTTVAEGVEDPAQLDFLESVGCALVQGFVFAKPMPRDEFERWTVERNADPKRPR